MKVTTPVEGFTGTVAGVSFADGVGDTTDANALNYFRRHGYGVGSKPAVEPGVDVAVQRAVDAAKDGEQREPTKKAAPAAKKSPARKPAKKAAPAAKPAK